MDIEGIQRGCESYFKMFDQLKQAKSWKETGEATLKILSLLTVVVPLGFGLAYGATKLLAGRVKEEDPPTEQSERVGQAAAGIIKPLSEGTDAEPMEQSVLRSIRSFRGYIKTPDSLSDRFDKLKEALTAFSKNGDLDATHGQKRKGSQTIREVFEECLKDDSLKADMQKTMDDSSEFNMIKKKAQTQADNICDGLRQILKKPE